MTYEYKIIYMKEQDPTEEELNALGEEGWELCGQNIALSGIKYIFKREKE